MTRDKVNQPDKGNRRRRGKTDVIDAEAAARAVLSGRATAVAKTSDGPVEMVRMLKMTKESAIKSRSQAINQLKAVVVRADPALRESLSGLSNPRLFRRCADLDRAVPTTAESTAVYALRSLARRILVLTEEIDDLNAQITATIATSHPGLLDCYGVGPDTAAALLITAGDNPERLHSEASLAACTASALSRHPQERPGVAGSIEAATAERTLLSTRSSSRVCAGTPAPATTSPAVNPKAKPDAKQSDASNDMSHERSIRSSPHPAAHRTAPRSTQQLDDP